jgi:hypothetical protein
MVSLALILLGLEMATKIVSLSFGRIMSGFSAIANGLDFHVSRLRFASGIAFFTVGVVIWMVGSFITRAERRMEAAGDRCPQCRAETHRAKRRMIHKIVSGLMGQELSRRQCKECSWSGLALKY